MGNRAVITFDKKVGIYLHWNGGRDSVEAFLLYCKLRGFRDGSYGLARLTQVITNWFGGDTSVGVGAYENLDCNNFDNGVYVIKDWEIVERIHFDGEEQDEYEIKEFIKEIDEKQPIDDQLFKDKKKLSKKDIEINKQENK